MKQHMIYLPLLLLSACASWPSMQAKWVERDYKKKIGVLEYLDQGAPGAIEMRRSNAVQKMGEFCGPKKFQIARELTGTKEYGGGGSRSGMSLAAASPTGAIAIRIGTEDVQVPIQMNYNYIAFSCVR